MKPIIFSGSMVKAILEGRKTQTRRVIRNSESDSTIYWNPIVVAGYGGWVNEHARPRPCPYSPGDFLWVRETWAQVPASAFRHSIDVQQTANPSDPTMVAVYREGWEHSKPSNWKPSIFMPRWASRITLKVEDVRVQRLQDISEAEAIAEGVSEPAMFSTDVPGRAGPLMSAPNYRAGFGCLWDSINGKKHPWSANDWVWALIFSVQEQIN